LLQKPNNIKSIIDLCRIKVIQKNLTEKQQLQKEDCSRISLIDSLETSEVSRYSTSPYILEECRFILQKARMLHFPSVLWGMITFKITGTILGSVIGPDVRVANANILK